MLLEDCLQQRVFASFRNLVRKGNLLHVTDIGRWFIHNSNPKIFVNCERIQVSLVQFDCAEILLAIKDLNSRYNLLVNKPELLANIVSLTVGDKVEVRLDSQVIPVTAVIRYIGPLGEEKFANYFGIEILVGIKYYVSRMETTIFIVIFCYIAMFVIWKRCRPCCFQCSLIIVT